MIGLVMLSKLPCSWPGQFHSVLAMLVSCASAILFERGLPGLCKLGLFGSNQIQLQMNILSASWFRARKMLNSAFRSERTAFKGQSLLDQIASRGTFTLPCNKLLLVVMFCGQPLRTGVPDAPWD